MQHLVVDELGTYLGTSGDCLTVKQGDAKRTLPLNRLRSLSIAKRGVSLSSELLEVLSARGINLSFVDFRDGPRSAPTPTEKKGVVAVQDAVSVRAAQQNYCHSNRLSLARRIVASKIKNERAVLLHLNGHHPSNHLINPAHALAQLAAKAATTTRPNNLISIERTAHSTYFEALRNARLIGANFGNLQGDSGTEFHNRLLNIGYTLLNGSVLRAMVNAHLEPSLGVMHQASPGGTGLVLDVMEEYRAWVVEREVIKFSATANRLGGLSDSLKKTLISNVTHALEMPYAYNGKSMKLDQIIQRQANRLAGEFCGTQQYHPMLFKW